MKDHLQEEEMERTSKGNTIADLPLADVREELGEKSDGDSNVCSDVFIPPWDRALTGEIRGLEESLETRAKVLQWLEWNAEEVDEAAAPAVTEVSGQPLEEMEEGEKGKELRSTFKKLALLEKKEKDAKRTQDDVLIPRAGDKLPEVLGKHVELMPNVEYFRQLNPGHLAVAICETGCEVVKRA